MRMHDIEVSILDGVILISQGDQTEVTQGIYLTAEQAELFCKWVTRAAELIQENEREEKQ